MTHDLPNWVWCPIKDSTPRTDLEGTPGNLEACGENPDPAFDLRKRMAKTREVDGRRLVVGWRCRSEIGTDAPSSRQPARTWSAVGGSRFELARSRSGASATLRRRTVTEQSGVRGTGFPH